MGIADEVKESAEIDDLRRSLAAAQRRARKTESLTENLVEATIEAATAAVLKHKPLPLVVVPPKDRRTKRRAEWALWHLTDWQGSKVTTSYDSEVMHTRVREFVTKAVHITDERRDARPIEDCCVVFTGDMIEGLFNYATQPFEIDKPLFDQWVTVSLLIVEVVQSALANYRNVHVIGEWGNHGRIGSKRAVVPKSDNVDRMVYEMARQLLQNEKRLTWSGDHEDIQRIEIGNYRALAIHGDEFGRNGFASPATIQNHVNRWASGAYDPDFKFRDVYLGHYHSHMELPRADGIGAIYWTGSTESDNRYARDSMASSAKPSQRLHFVQPDDGYVTAQYRLLLK